jgi:hypothetical protein
MKNQEFRKSGDIIAIGIKFDEDLKLVFLASTSTY